MSLVHKYQDLLPTHLQVMRVKGQPTFLLSKKSAMKYERFCGHFDNRHFLMTDHDEAHCSIDELYDLEPNIVVYNPQDPKRHQAFWYLRDPVHCQSSARSSKPYRYLRAIEAAYDAKYGCDIHFARYIHKNPKFWAADTEWRHDRAYTLTELASVVDLQPQRIKKGSKIVEEKGRNVTLFNDLRFWAYSNATNAQQTMSYDEWHSRVVTRAMSFNSFTEPLALNETLVIARSVAEFTYFRYKPASKSTELSDSARERKARLGAIGGKKSKGGGRPPAITAENAERIELMISMGYTQVEMAEKIGVSLSTIKRHIALLKC